MIKNFLLLQIQHNNFSRPFKSYINNIFFFEFNFSEIPRYWEIVHKKAENLRTEKEKIVQIKKDTKNPHI